MILERPVYNLKGQFAGHKIFKQDVNDKEDKEIFIGFRNALKEV